MDDEDEGDDIVWCGFVSPSGLVCVRPAHAGYPHLTEYGHEWVEPAPGRHLRLVR